MAALSGRRRITQLALFGERLDVPQWSDLTLPTCVEVIRLLAQLLVSVRRFCQPDRGGHGARVKQCLYRFGFATILRKALCHSRSHGNHQRLEEAQLYHRDRYEGQIADIVPFRPGNFSLSREAISVITSIVRRRKKCRVWTCSTP
jgi:hypothetical protein